MCSAHALFVFKVSRLNFLRSFSDRCARSPEVLKIRKHHGAQNAESFLRGVWKVELLSGRNHFVRRTSSGHFLFFTRHSEGAVLLNFKWLRQQAQAYGKSATGAGRIIGPLSGGSARTRDQSDLCKWHIHFGR